MSQSVKFKSPYGHSNEETWKRIDIFCPACGKKEVWREEDWGDYYVGEEYLCTACGASFHLAGGLNNVTELDASKKRLEVIKRLSALLPYNQE